MPRRAGIAFGALGGGAAVWTADAVCSGGVPGNRPYRGRRGKGGGEAAERDNPVRSGTATCTPPDWLGFRDRPVSLRHAAEGGSPHHHRRHPPWERSFGPGHRPRSRPSPAQDRGGVLQSHSARSGQSGAARPWTARTHSPRRAFRRSLWASSFPGSSLRACWAVSRALRYSPCRR